MSTDYNQEDEMMLRAMMVATPVNATNSVPGNAPRDADVESLRLDFLDLNDANW